WIGRPARHGSVGAVLIRPVLPGGRSARDDASLRADAMTRLAIATSFAAALALGTGVAGQQTRPPVFRSGTDRVRVDVAVMNHGKPVAGLAAADFEIKDNGIVVPALELAMTMGDVSVAVALDLSGSVKEHGWDEMVNAC